MGESSNSHFFRWKFWSKLKKYIN